MSEIKEQYIKEIDESISELNTLPGKVNEPIKDEIKFMGTILASTICFLSSAANSLDQGCRVKKFDAIEDWSQVISAINRSFYSSIIISTELGLEHFVRKKGGEIKSTFEKQFEDKYKDLSKFMKGEIKDKCDKLFEKLIKNKKPIFTDYLNSALKLSTFDDKGKKSIKRFFRALTIVRNKSSHSNPSLSESEKDNLIEGGFCHFISNEGTLRATPKDYYTISMYIIRFFEKLN